MNLILLINNEIAGGTVVIGGSEKQRCKFQLTADFKLGTA